MRTRTLSSVAVVIVGLLPTLVGGPVFALLMVALGIGGFREYSALAAKVAVKSEAWPHLSGFATIVTLGIAALALPGVAALFAITVFAIAAPLIAMLPHASAPEALAASALVAMGSLYLGLPIYAAISLRSMDGRIEAPWLADLSASLAFGWPPASYGLAWALLAIVATWVGDSAAYLTGRAFGRRKLAPAVSPGKTIEGALGGLAGSALTGGTAFLAFGIGAWPFGIVAGALIGVAGQLGDLSESFMKRQAGIKDSGDLIPGHGGILDRIDALLFAFPTALITALILNRLGS